MPDPTKYTVNYDFSNFQASNPSSPLPADRVDVELQDIEASLGETIEGLKDIRRSDGKLKNGIVTLSSFSTGVAALLDDTGVVLLEALEEADASATAAAGSATAAADSATAAADSATAALSAVAAQEPYSTRSAFISASVPAESLRVSFFVNGETYAVVRDATGPIVQGNGQTWRPDGDVTPQHFGGIANGVADDTAAINAALDALVAFGGGTLYFPAGAYLVSNFNTTTTTWDNEVAIHVLDSNIHLKGAGRSATTIRLADAGEAFIIKFGRRFEGAVTVDNCSVSGMTLDGNRANQGLPTDTNDHWGGIDVASGCSRVTIRDLNVLDTAYYGISFQRDGIWGCLVDNVAISGTGGDGIDAKNDSGTGYANVIQNCTISNFGIVSALTNAQAGIDVRSGWTVSNCQVEMNSVSDNRGIRTLGDGDATGLALSVHPIRLLGSTVRGTGQAASVGVEIGTRATVVSDCYVSNCGTGFDTRRSDCQISNPIAVDCATGMNFAQDSVTVLEADTITVSGGLIRATTTGVAVNSVDGVTFDGLHVRGPGAAGTGYSITSGSTGIKILGGSCTGWTTLLSDSGTSTVVRDVAGVKTSAVGTASIAIDSTGAKSFSVAHGMDITPDFRDVDLQLRRSTNVGDWAASVLWVTSVDATNVNGQLIVATASATPGAVVEVIVRVNAKAI